MLDSGYCNRYCTDPTAVWGAKVIDDTMPELCLDKFPGFLGVLGSHVLRLEEHASALMANRVLAVHELHAKRLVQSGIPRKKITVVLNAPNPELFHPIDFRPSVNSRFILLTHGTINRRLGIDTRIDVVDLLRGRVPSLKFRIVGRGEHLDALRAHAKRLSLDNLISFESGVPLNRLRSVLASGYSGIGSQ